MSIMAAWGERLTRISAETTDVKRVVVVVIVVVVLSLSRNFSGGELRKK